MLKKPRLFLNYSIYKDSDAINDINPLLIEKYKKHNILIIVPRTPDLIRLAKWLALDEIKKKPIVCCGWWEIKKLGLFDKEENINLIELKIYDIIIVLNKNKVAEQFLPLLDKLIAQCR